MFIIGNEKDVYKMFSNKKIRTVTAFICAVVLMMINTSLAVAAPYSYSSVEDIRSKALKNYLSSNGIIAMGKAISTPKEMAVTSESTVTVKEPVNYNTIKRLNAALPAGDTVTVREGVIGEKEVIYNVKFENGVEVSREVVTSYVTKAPVDRIVEYCIENESTQAAAAAVATSNSTVDRSKLDYKYYIDCEATAYDMSAEENGGYAGQTATGVPLEKGVIAVDPRVIPLGSRVYVEAIDGSWSYGYAVAADTGGAIKGKRVDLCFRTRKECIQFGRKKCRVYILN